MIKGKMSTLISIILAIIIVALLIQAGMNKGKLWGEQEYYKPSSCSTLPSFGACNLTTHNWSCTSTNSSGCCISGSCTPK
jgi:hypothetical protein